MSKYYSMICEAVSMKDAIRMYLPGERMTAGRIKCPFHNGNDKNFAVYDNCYVCYVCGAKGNVITLVQNLFDISRKEAEEKLNEDFNLCFPIGEKRYSREEQRKANDRLREHLAKKNAEQIHRDAKESRWLLLWSIWITANDMRLEALEEVSCTGKYPEWAKEAFDLFLWIDSEIKEGGDWDDD